jgi:hypothetical protein|nr:MAG TPA: hypothetical protein [Caudoviricetes sp.]
MIVKTEEKIYNFLKGKLSYKGINVYRGTLPETKHSDREEREDVKKLFPFVLLRLTEFKQTRTGIDSYDVPVDFELWIGTKLDDETDYLKNLEIGDYLKQEFLGLSSLEWGFSVDQSAPFSVEYFNDEMYPYFYSLCRFKIFGVADVTETMNDEINKLLGRS